MIYGLDTMTTTIRNLVSLICTTNKAIESFGLQIRDKNMKGS